MLLEAFEETSVFTVSQLNAQVKELLETTFSLIWVKGEISNLRIPASGHCYFTLKDDRSQIRAVLFRSQLRNVRFTPESGLEVLCQGRLSVYDPRGEYQLIVEVMEPQGAGALQVAFEQLKKKLEAEGLFDAAMKKPLPICPQRIAIVTSPTGAAIRDILKVLQRSPCPLDIMILPVRVQGQEASREIASAIEMANLMADRFLWDLLVVGRGGGSIEDLWPFNEEIVARAVSRSSIPVISAVGHEIDMTICDLVADLRSPTPTAAAEWIVHRLECFERDVSTCLERIHRCLRDRISTYAQRLDYLEKRIIDPKRRLQDLRLFIDDRLERLQMALQHRLEKLRIQHGHLLEKLFLHTPLRMIDQYGIALSQEHRQLILHHKKILDKSRFELQKCILQLESLNPLSILARGYSITYRLPDNVVVRSRDDVQLGQKVRVRLSEGELECLVEGTDGAIIPGRKG